MAAKPSMDGLDPPWPRAGEMEVEEGLEFASENMEEWEAGRAKQNARFLCSFPFVPFFLAGLGGGGLGSPLRRLDTAVAWMDT